MEKITEYVKNKPIEVLIVVLLLVVIYQQIKIKEEAESCQCWRLLDDMQDDINDIKDRLRR